MTTEKQALKASTTNSIQIILQDYYQYRAYIKFNNGKLMTLYGHEHNCTYLQCLHGHVDKIVLSRLKGYTALLNYVEQTKKGQHTKAIIYKKEPGSEKFDTVCRRYFKGQIEEINDPVITDADVLILEYQIINNRVVIKSPGSSVPDEEIDFKKEVNNSLNNKKPK